VRLVKPVDEASPRRTTRPSGLWWKIAVVALLSIVGSYTALVCLVNYLLLGLAGAPVGAWEPLLWPLGLIASVAVPVLTSWWLLPPKVRPWAPVLTVTGIAVGLFAVMGMLGSSS